MSNGHFGSIVKLASELRLTGGNIVNAISLAIEYTAHMIVLGCHHTCNVSSLEHTLTVLENYNFNISLIESKNANVSEICLSCLGQSVVYLHNDRIFVTSNLAQRALQYHHKRLQQASSFWSGSNDHHDNDNTYGNNL